jgi:hypothetical protein
MWLLLYHGSCTNGRYPSIFILFQDSLTMIYTTSNLGTYLEVVLGCTKYHHQDSDIPSTQFMWPLLYHGSWTNGRDPYIFILFQDSLTINCTTSNLATYLEVVLGCTKYHHKDSDIPSTQFMWLLLYHGSWTNGRDPSIFILFQDSLTMNYI